MQKITRIRSKFAPKVQPWAREVIGDEQADAAEAKARIDISVGKGGVKDIFYTESGMVCIESDNGSMLAISPSMLDIEEEPCEG